MTFPTCSICLWNLTCLQPPLRTGRSLTTGIGAINISDITRGAVALCAEKKEGRLVDYNSIAAEAIRERDDLRTQLAAAEAREARLREGLVHYARQNGNYYTPYGSPHFNDGGLARSLLEVKDD